MRKSIFFISIFFFLFSTFTLVSCGSDDPKEDEYLVQLDRPGYIAGLGKIEGDLAGRSFRLPSTLTLVGDITGYSKDGNQEPQEGIIGSGPMTLLFSLKNTTNEDVKVEFPAGLIMKSRDKAYQHGVLIKKINLTIPAGVQPYNIVLHLYSGNSGKNSPSTSEIYDFGVVSSSQTVIGFCSRFNGKKINYEEFTNEGDTEKDYTTQAGVIQPMLWKLTDSGRDLSSTDLAYVNKIPASGGGDLK